MEKCKICGQELSIDMLSAGMCLSCGSEISAEDIKAAENNMDEQEKKAWAAMKKANEDYIVRRAEQIKSEEEQERARIDKKLKLEEEKALEKQRAMNAKPEYQKKVIDQFLSETKASKEVYPVFELDGCRGRSIKVFTDRVIITTAPTAGAFLTGNATDGEKTIFYCDVIGIQYKDPGMTIGYLQLETASNLMNNETSSLFNENTYTFEKDIKTVRLMKDYITWQVAKFKHL